MLAFCGFYGMYQHFSIYYNVPPAATEVAKSAANPAVAAAPAAPPTAYAIASLTVWVSELVLNLL